MKLLGWMHRKFWQNNGDTGRDLATVSYCLHCISGMPSPEHLLPNPPPPVHRKDLLPAETESPELNASILLDGLLHIGTFGSPILFRENGTPAITANEIAGKETEMPTESELIAISVELGKVIAEESENEKKSGERVSSARPSYAGPCGGKVSDVCPLQDFLFGSTVEAVEKRRRGSLGELFMRSRAAEEGGGGGAKRKGILIADEEAVKLTPEREKMSVETKGMLKFGGEPIGNGGSCGTETIQNVSTAILFMGHVHD
ncbi:protein LAZY 1-like [Phalaenopsis equestris]|uniref:protein LAZY 1-like n=1 Tax=Phalaenopsis equestris TaxID=78828 RepID=UPI0009E24230|nr:protein LAZY 1-like [Phalaenopsis equestris]